MGCHPPRARTLTSQLPSTPGARCLVVGAGAVGQVIGACLQRGGAHVGVRVRDRYVESARRGFAVGRAGAPALSMFIPDHVEATSEPVEGAAWDAVWLCTSSPALGTDEWLAPLCRGVGDATIIFLQPGLHDRARVSELAGESRVVRGMVAFSAWQGPLPGGEGAPGLRWWRPPLAGVVLAGHRAGRLAPILRRGGMPAPVASAGRVDAQLALVGGVIQPLVAALEASGWSFETLRQRGLGQVAQAAREAIAVSAAVRGAAAPWWLGLLRGPGLALGTRVAQAVAPFDFERFLEVHFTKVGAQTRKALSALVEDADRRGLPRAGLARLRDGVGGTRTPTGTLLQSDRK